MEPNCNNTPKQSNAVPINHAKHVASEEWHGNEPKLLNLGSHVRLQLLDLFLALLNQPRLTSLQTRRSCERRQEALHGGETHLPEELLDRQLVTSIRYNHT